jgi:hypothetical protein
MLGVCPTLDGPVAPSHERHRARLYDNRLSPLISVTSRLVASRCLFRPGARPQWRWPRSPLCIALQFPALPPIMLTRDGSRVFP